VFSMQQYGAPASEFRALVDAAVAARVEPFVHSTVPGVREQETLLDRYEGDLKQDYWRSKVGQERVVRAAPFQSRAYLRPALIVDNLVLRAQCATAAPPAPTPRALVVAMRRLLG